MPDINLGSSAIGDLKLGSGDVSKVYLGSTEIWAPASGGSHLDSEISGVVFELDARKSDSYDGTSDTWLNLTASPADSESQSDYDFYLGTGAGADTADPSFVGTAGDSGAYFENDGGDKFTIAGGNTTFLEALHKTTGGTDFTLIVEFFKGPENDLVTLLETRASGTGILFGMAGGGNDKYLAAQEGTSQQNFVTSVNPDDSAWNTAIFSFDSSASTLRVWNNSSTIAQEGTWTFDTTTAAAQNAAMLFENSANGSRLRHVSMTNTFIDASDAATIISYLGGL